MSSFPRTFSKIYAWPAFAVGLHDFVARPPRKYRVPSCHGNFGVAWRPPWQA